MSIGPASGSRRVDRGGGWRSDSLSTRVVVRSHNAPGLRIYSLSFRLARRCP